MMCVPITASSNKEAVKEIKKAEMVADIIELRTDYIRNPDLKRLLQKRKRPIIVTNRKKSEGGRFSGSEKNRVGLLKEAIDLGADYVDIELSSGKKVINEIIKNKKKSRIVVSYHNLKNTPANLANICKKIKKLKPDIIKIATLANSINDNLRIFDLIKRAKKENRKIIAFCMGEKGEASRILAIKCGSYLTFASLKKGRESAPGQLTVEEMRMFRVNKLNQKTRIFGLIGNPVAYSLSPAVHNNLFKRFGLNCVFLRFKVDNLREFVNWFRHVSGLSITMPHKEGITRYLDKTNSDAKAIGAVNTVVKRRGKLVGYNTDLVGAIKALKEKTAIRKKRVAVVGAGGAAKAVALGIKMEGGELTIVNRTLERAKEMAKKLNCSYDNLGLLRKARFDVIINCTSVGMDENKSLIPERILKGCVVMDIVYSPLETRLLREAKQKGCVVVDGLSMFIYTIAAQFEMWTKKKAQIKYMTQIAKKAATRK